MKNIAIIINHPPHGDAKGREALDIALALSDINHIALFFTGEGVLHLLPDQNPTDILMRNYIATLKMLELYDIEDVYVSEESLERYGFLTTKAAYFRSVIPIKKINTNTLQQLLSKQDVILRF